MSLEATQQLSLVVPTKNRPEFVIRLVHYLATAGFEGTVSIGDSSDEAHATQTAQAIHTIGGRFQMVYRRYPALNESQTSAQLVAQVETPYVVWVADDDFVIPRSLGRCVEFLEAHPDYSLAHGHSSMLMLQCHGPSGPVEAVWRHYFHGITAETASERLREYLESQYFTTSFSVHRTAQMQAAYRQNDQILALQTGLFAELLTCSLPILQGKAKQLDCLYLVRHHHNRRCLPTGDWYDWLTSPEWLVCYTGFRDGLVEELSRQDGLSPEQAREVVKQAFWPYLAHRTMSRWRRRQRQANDPLKRWRDRARRVPGLKKTWRILRSLIAAPRDISLAALLRPSSPYHEDFLPVYRTLTEAPWRKHLAEPEAIESRERTLSAVEGRHVIGR